MSLDIVELRDFYSRPLGQAVRRVIRGRVRRLWPDARGESVLAIGHATPLLRPFLDDDARLAVMMPSEQGVAFWPREGPNICGLTQTSALPFADESMDRVLLIHVLEVADTVDALMREVWRVLKGHGRLLVIVPNRTGLWAHSDRTPFGTGQPFSHGQLKALMRAHGFTIERFAPSLYMPPHEGGVWHRLAPSLEAVGPRLFPSLCGLLVLEARRPIYMPVLTKTRVARGRFVLPVPSLPVQEG